MLTNRQKQILDQCADYIADCTKRGVIPSMTDCAAGLGISRQGLAKHIALIRRKGFKVWA